MARSNKTSNVLKLLGADSPKKPEKQAKPEDITPPAIEEEIIPKKKKPRRSVTKNLDVTRLKEPAPRNPTLRRLNVTEEEPGTTVDVTRLAVEEKLLVTMQRFNVCTCGVCCRKVTELALDMLPIRIVQVKDTTDNTTVDRIVWELQPQVMQALTKLCLAGRSNPYHLW